MGGIQSKTKRKLLFLGLDNAGKSTILEYLTSGGADLQVVAPTRGFARKQLQYSGFDLTIFDVGGQSSLRAHWSDYYAKTSGIVWVIDSTDRRRMFETGLELRTVLEDTNLAGVPLLICANKQDIRTAMRADEITIELELHGIRNRNWHIQDCSAITGDGVDEGMKWLSQNFFEDRTKSPQKFDNRQPPKPQQQLQQPAPRNPDMKSGAEQAQEHRPKPSRPRKNRRNEPAAADKPPEKENATEIPPPKDDSPDGPAPKADEQEPEPVTKE